MDQVMRKKILAAYDLLEGDLTTSEKFESVRTLIRGANPKIDGILKRLSKIHTDLSKLEQGEIVELTAENLPEKTEKDKKRKKAILLFIKNWNQLKSEIERIKNESEKTDLSKNNLKTTSNILARAKGPLGIITIAAVAIVAVGLFFNSQNQKVEKVTTKEKIKVIDFNGKKIPLSELTTGIGPECLTNNKPAEHYHAKDHTQARALDGTVVQDPGGCGFGKVSSTRIEEI